MTSSPIVTHHGIRVYPMFNTWVSFKAYYTQVIKIDIADNVTQHEKDIIFHFEDKFVKSSKFAKNCKKITYMIFEPWSFKFIVNRNIHFVITQHFYTVFCSFHNFRMDHSTCTWVMKIMFFKLIKNEMKIISQFWRLSESQNTVFWSAISHLKLDY